MKILTFVLTIVILSSCGNKKAEIVQEMKKTKNQLIEAQMNQKAFYRASTKLLLYNNSISDSKKYGGKQMEAIAKINKEAYETSIQELKGMPSDILKDRKKLDSIAFIYEKKTWELAHRLDSLELELKKY